MARTLTLAEVLLEEVAPDGGGDPTRAATHVLTSGLQALLTLLTAAMVADIVRSQQVPRGFTAKFHDSLTSPSLGKLHQFLLWMASIRASPGLTTLPSYLRQAETRPTAWLGQLVQLRNRWVHSKDEDPDQVLRHVVRLLPSAPEVLRTAAVELDDSAQAFWIDRDRKLLLHPFAFGKDDRLHVFSSMEPPDVLLFSSANPVLQEQFKRLWSELRVLDRALEHPSSADFHAKARRNHGRYAGEAPWWLDRVRERGPIAFLVAPGLLEGALANVLDSWGGASSIDLALSKGEPPWDHLALRLGFAKAPTHRELASFTSADAPCLIAIRSGALPARDFLQLLYHLVDLSSEGRPEHLRILVERERALLESDQQKLWDRMPEDLGQALRRPPGSSGRGLIDYQWTSKRPKRFLGLFWRRQAT
ncbi:MAG: hypothetical protein HY727_07865 [Candidatus Rokubacteria bacterium]|nr:hypothetical protein [Candidatus Rokubacteria bacterium]